MLVASATATRRSHGVLEDAEQEVLAAAPTASSRGRSGAEAQARGAKRAPGPEAGGQGRRAAGRAAGRVAQRCRRGGRARRGGPDELHLPRLAVELLLLGAVTHFDQARKARKARPVALIASGRRRCSLVEATACSSLIGRCHGMLVADWQRGLLVAAFIGAPPSAAAARPSHHGEDYDAL